MMHLPSNIKVLKNDQKFTPVSDPSKPELYYQSVASGMVHGVTCLLLLVATFAHRGMSQPLGLVINRILGPEIIGHMQEAWGETPLQLDVLVSGFLIFVKIILRKKNQATIF